MYNTPFGYRKRRLAAVKSEKLTKKIQQENEIHEVEEEAEGANLKKDNTSSKEFSSSSDSEDLDYDEKVRDGTRILAGQSAVGSRERVGQQPKRTSYKSPKISKVYSISNRNKTSTRVGMEKPSSFTSSKGGVDGEGKSQQQQKDQGPKKRRPKPKVKDESDIKGKIFLPIPQHIKIAIQFMLNNHHAIHGLSIEQVEEKFRLVYPNLEDFKHADYGFSSFEEMLKSKEMKGHLCTARVHSDLTVRGKAFSHFRGRLNYDPETESFSMKLNNGQQDAQGPMSSEKKSQLPIEQQQQQQPDMAIPPTGTASRNGNQPEQQIPAPTGSQGSSIALILPIPEVSSKTATAAPPSLSIATIKEGNSNDIPALAFQNNSSLAGLGPPPIYSHTQIEGNFVNDAQFYRRQELPENYTQLNDIAHANPANSSARDDNKFSTTNRHNFDFQESSGGSPGFRPRGRGRHTIGSDYRSRQFRTRAPPFLPNSEVERGSRESVHIPRSRWNPTVPGYDRYRSNRAYNWRRHSGEDNFIPHNPTEQNMAFSMAVLQHVKLIAESMHLNRINAPPPPSGNEVIEAYDDRTVNREH